jgi:outer membrane protein OmpA-like peptidoglycan-associated protein
MKSTDYIQLIKTLTTLLVLAGLLVGCASRPGPAYITGADFANLPKAPPIVAMPLPLNALGTQTSRGLRLTLNSVLFETNKASLLPEGQRQVEEFAAIIQQSGGNRIVVVEGHTDNQGSKAYNQRLSVRRAKTIRKALINQGINSERLIAKGFGEKQPVATNATSAGRQQNRRVEIIILNEGLSP